MAKGKLQHGKYLSAIRNSLIPFHCLAAVSLLLTTLSGSLRSLPVLYGDKRSSSVNECRYALFKAGKCSDEVLPPTGDSLLKHVERANYQAGTWSRCLTAKMTIPSPIGNGWQLSNEGIEIHWMTHHPAPDSLLKCANCKCKTGCQTKRCSCQKSGLKCTELCSCVACQNTDAHENEEHEENLSDDEVSDDGDFEDIDGL